MNQIGTSSTGDDFWERPEGGSPDFAGDKCSCTMFMNYYRRSGADTFLWFSCLTGKVVEDDKLLLELEGERNAAIGKETNRTTSG